MRVKTHFFCPVWFTASAQMKVTGFGFHHAQITRGFGSKAIIAVALSKRFIGLCATGYAGNSTRPLQLNMIAHQLGKRRFKWIQNQTILHICCQ